MRLGSPLVHCIRTTQGRHAMTTRLAKQRRDRSECGRAIGKLLAGLLVLSGMTVSGAPATALTSTTPRVAPVVAFVGDSNETLAVSDFELGLAWASRLIAP